MSNPFLHKSHYSLMALALHVYHKLIHWVSVKKTNKHTLWLGGRLDGSGACRKSISFFLGKISTPHGVCESNKCMAPGNITVILKCPCFTLRGGGGEWWEKGTCCCTTLGYLRIICTPPEFDKLCQALRCEGCVASAFKSPNLQR